MLTHILSGIGPRKPGPYHIFIGGGQPLDGPAYSAMHWAMLPSTWRLRRPHNYRGMHGWWRPLPCGGFTQQGLTAAQSKTKKRRQP